MIYYQTTTTPVSTPTTTPCETDNENEVKKKIKMIIAATNITLIQDTDENLHSVHAHSSSVDLNVPSLSPIETEITFNVSYSKV